MVEIKILSKINKVSCFIDNKNGLQCIESDNELLIRNDPFCTVPLHIYKNRKTIYVFSDWEEVLNLNHRELIVDIVGFWETYLYGTTLFDRSIFKSIKTLPGASELNIDKYTGDYSIKRYWNYSVPIDNKINSLETAVYGFIDHLDRIFSKLDSNKKYLLGLSGGLDSRITVAYLSKYISRNNISLFTYGYNKNILEYQYAKYIASKLNLNIPTFHQLKNESYLSAREYLPIYSGGEIGVNHCHIIDFLRNNSDLKNYCQISTYYSDAVFGWDCSIKKKQCEKIDNLIDYHLFEELGLRTDVQNKIKNDFEMVFKDYKTIFNYSSLSEYKYLTERNQKFHFNLANIQKKYMKTELIFADEKLLKYYLSLPIEFRAQKRILEEILKIKFPEISSNKLDNVSSRAFRTDSMKFSTRNIYLDKINWLIFKFINRINLLLRIFINGKFQIYNKYQTEEQERVYLQEFREIQKEAVSFLHSKGLLKKRQIDYLSNIPVHNTKVNRCFSLIGIYDFLKLFNLLGQNEKEK